MMGEKPLSYHECLLKLLIFENICFNNLPICDAKHIPYGTYAAAANLKHLQDSAFSKNFYERMCFRERTGICSALVRKIVNI
jgi:hypothetical protein